jgi:hypothetical protein
MGYVTMNTKGSGEKYEHDLVEVVNPQRLIHYGWYYHFSHVCTA